MSKPIAAMLPETGIATPCQPGGQRLLSTIARLESLKHAVAEQDRTPSTAELDVLAAEWFDAAVSSYGKADALAAELGVDKSYLSRMRSGKVPVALRHLLPLLQSREAVLALVAPLCAAVGLEPPQPKKEITRAQVLEAALSYLLESPPLLKSFSREASEHLGVEPGDVLRALK
jgi:transcriptional regulator with XRE-family HTH domain